LRWILFEILGETQVIIVDAESILVFTQDVQILFVDFLRDLEVTSPSDFFPRQSFPLHFWKAVVDVLAH
jgi:hypothetical protein